MCGATAIAIAGLALSVASTVTSAVAQEAQLDQQYNEAMQQKRLADQVSSARLKADRDALNSKSQLEREKSMREQMNIQKNAIKDVGDATVQAAASGASGLSVDSLITDLYRQRDDAKDVAAINAAAARESIANEVASKTTDHRYQLASGTPSRGSGTSGLAMAIDIGTAATTAGSTYLTLKDK